MNGKLDQREIVSFDIGAAPHVVWEHLRVPAKIKRWYGWDHEGLDGEIQKTCLDGSRTFEAAQGSSGPVRTVTWPGGELLTVASAAEGRRTTLTVERPSYEGQGLFDTAPDGLGGGWEVLAQQLRFALEVHVGQDRRMVRVVGLDAGTSPDRLLERAGLHSVRVVHIGAPLQVHCPSGARRDGTLIYRSQHHFAVQLHGPSEALLLIEESAALADAPHGLVTASMSTYGLDDEQFTEMETRWNGWWAAAQESTLHGAPTRRSSVAGAPVLA